MVGKKLLLVLLLLTISSSLWSMDESITLIAAEDLEIEFGNNGFDHFLEKTNIHQRLGGKTVTLSCIINTLETSLKSYVQSVDEVAKVAMLLRKKDLLQCILLYYASPVLDRACAVAQELGFTDYND